MSTWADLDNAARDLLVRLYARQPRTVDELPYTDEFERLHRDFTEQVGKTLTRHEFWRVLSGARKASRLPRKHGTPPNETE